MKTINTKQKKNNIAQHTYCYGCSVCAAICPKTVISLQLNKDGFYAPVVDEDACIHCGVCMEVCPMEHFEPMSDTAIKAYATWSKDDDVRQHASSGGTGMEVAMQLQSEEYEFVGVRYNTAKQHAEHYVTLNAEEIKASTGSKYLQSYPLEAFCQLSKSHKYLVTGTPCQIAAVRNMVRMRKMENSVVLMDFFCHGVPSYLLWQKYINEKSAEGVGTIQYVSWRSKQYGWHNSWVMRIDGEAQTNIDAWKKGDMFYKFFLSDVCLNRVCYAHCPFKMNRSAADLRIGDLWGEEYAADEQGVTGVLTFTPRGDALIQRANIERYSHTPETIMEGQISQAPRKPWYYSITMMLLRSPLRLKTIYTIMKAFRVREILNYKLRKS